MRARPVAKFRPAVWANSSVRVMAEINPYSHEVSQIAITGERGVL